MSLDRRKPFSVLHPNIRPAVAATPAIAYPTISRPRRQMPGYHSYLQNNGSKKRYATMLPSSSRSSATSSAESLYSSTSSMPRRRKLSAAEDVAARVRARWAALEALERGGAAQPTDTTTTMNMNTNTVTTTTDTRAGTGTGAADPDVLVHYGLLQCSPDQEKENIAPMQVDVTYEKPLPHVHPRSHCTSTLNLGQHLRTQQ
ncbi:hypothetical protein B0F90DRAFT_973979 [Multifurca ochricompacta]|uniref:Uncharacterized protein n=1 Tax=Multifurca ochricompacta TaxID=376703 RepID=A0AAD4QRM6_9AGAM|nr:hypothetical protein B0F90DRAFT_973979 [Multifurca ochricompacta]